MFEASMDTNIATKKQSKNGQDSSSDQTKKSTPTTSLENWIKGAS